MRSTSPAESLVHFGQRAGSWGRPRAHAVHFIAVVGRDEASANPGAAGLEDSRLVSCSQGDTRWLSLPPLLSGHATTLGKHRSRIVAVTYSQRQRCVVAVDEDAVSRCVCILKINPRRGTVHTTAALVSRGRSLRNVRAICYGPKSFGEMQRPR